MRTNPVKCPKCGKTLIFHIKGTDATYQIKCRNRECQEIVIIFSAGQTAKWGDIEKENTLENTFHEVDKMMRHNRFPIFD